jgi:hypothetical protein
MAYPDYGDSDKHKKLAASIITTSKKVRVHILATALGSCICLKTDGKRMKDSQGWSRNVNVSVILGRFSLSYFLS